MSNQFVPRATLDNIRLREISYSTGVSMFLNIHGDMI